jgi:hypothetical protein
VEKENVSQHSSPNECLPRHDRRETDNQLTQLGGVGEEFVIEESDKWEIVWKDKSQIPLATVSLFYDFWVISWYNDYLLSRSWPFLHLSVSTTRFGLVDKWDIGLKDKRSDIVLCHVTFKDCWKRFFFLKWQQNTVGVRFCPSHNTSLSLTLPSLPPLLSSPLPCGNNLSSSASPTCTGVKIWEGCNGFIVLIKELLLVLVHLHMRKGSHGWPEQVMWLDHFVMNQLMHAPHHADSKKDSREM